MGLLEDRLKVCRRPAVPTPLLLQLVNHSSSTMSGDRRFPLLGHRVSMKQIQKHLEQQNGRARQEAEDGDMELNECIY